MTIDRGRPFMPERFTPLAFTDLYAELPEPVRRRYNQLHALYLGEVVAYFEEEVLVPMLRSLLRRLPEDPWRPKLEAFLDDEQRHTAMFRDLNRRAAPELYATRDRVFVRTPWFLFGLVRGIAARPFWAPLLAWLVLVQEERSLAYARGFVDEADTLEPSFVAAHRIHLADESRHVRVDAELVEHLWTSSSRLVRLAHARLLGWALVELFFLPKRSGRRVVDQLADEHPELDRAALRRALRRVGGDRAFFSAQYSDRMTPRSIARMHQHPELERVTTWLTGNAPAAGEIDELGPAH